MYLHTRNTFQRVLKTVTFFKREYNDKYILDIRQQKRTHYSIKYFELSKKYSLHLRFLLKRKSFFYYTILDINSPIGISYCRLVI